MSNVMILNQPQVMSGLGTMTYTVPSGTATQTYNVKVDLTEVPVSGLSVVVKQNSSTKFTAPTITPTQSAQQFKFVIELAASDQLDVVYASSTAIDNQLNTVKSITSIGQGL